MMDKWINLQPPLHRLEERRSVRTLARLSSLALDPMLEQQANHQHRHMGRLRQLLDMVTLHNLRSQQQAIRSPDTEIQQLRCPWPSQPMDSMVHRPGTSHLRLAIQQRRRQQYLA